MREIYEKYYTVRLYSCPDLHFAPTIIDTPGEYDTEEEARAAAEPEYRKTCSYNEVTGQSYSWFEVQVIEHYKKRKTGKWLYDISRQDAIEAMFTLPRCSICGVETPHPQASYCPHCGAKMEVDE